MAVELEIRDGTPWYLSPDVWVVADPSDSTEITPIAGTACYLKARVRNNGTSSVTDATVNFYWANPSVGVTRSTATLVGQSFVSLNAGDVQDVLCLTPWEPEYLNEGHECILAEAFHPSDPISSSTDFNVPTDRHVAQRNLTVVIAMNGMFHLNFEMHNGQRNERKFHLHVEQIKLDRIIKDNPKLEQLTRLKDKKEGKLKKAIFTNKICPDPNFKESEKKLSEYKLSGFGKKHIAIAGKIEGDFAFLLVSQRDGLNITGGLGILIINQ